MKASRRPVCAGDEEFLWRLYAATRAEEVAAWGWPTQQQDQFLRMQYRARSQSYAVEYANADQSILLDGDTVIGAMIVALTDSEARLVDISLLPEYRGRGWGSAAIRELIAEAERRRLPLRLSVMRSNRAQRLYQRLGFVAKGGDAMYIEMEYATARSETNPQ